MGTAFLVVGLLGTDFVLVGLWLLGDWETAFRLLFFGLMLFGLWISWLLFFGVYVWIDCFLLPLQEGCFGPLDIDLLEQACNAPTPLGRRSYQ